MSDDDYQQRAQQHRPTSMEALAAEVRRLHRDGLSVRDIAVALQLNDADVAEMLDLNLNLEHGT